MCGNQSGMDGGLKFILSRLTDLQILRLKEYPGNTELGMLIGQLHNLRELYLSGSSMVNDDVIKAVAEGCTKLEILDVSVPVGHPESSRFGYLSDEGLLAVAYHVPELKELNVERRSYISDEGVAAILSNAHIEVLSLASSEFITDTTLEALSVYCSSRLYQLNLTQLNNVPSWAILNLCKAWFGNCSQATGYTLELNLDEMAFDIRDFAKAFKPVTKNSTHEFMMEAGGGRPRRIMNVNCDMLTTLFSD